MLRGWAGVFAVATATFTVVTSEMPPVGMLTPIGRTLRIGEGTAGLTLTGCRAGGRGVGAADLGALAQPAGEREVRTGLVATALVGGRTAQVLGIAPVMWVAGAPAAAALLIVLPRSGTTVRRR